MTENPKNNENLEEKAKERLKIRKEKAKKKRPEYKKKRVIVPAVTAGILIIIGIILAVHSTFFQSTDDAFVEGRLVSIAPRVQGPVIKLLETVLKSDADKIHSTLEKIDQNAFELAVDTILDRKSVV